MAIDTEHPEYIRRKADWQRMRDTIAGQEQMRDNAELYMRLPAEADAATKARYINATLFFEATGRTMEGLSGLAFYRDPELTLPPAMGDFVKDVTQDGVPLRQFAKSVLEEVLAVARVGVMVDFPPTNPNIRTRRDEEKARRRPFMRRYVTEDVFNWEVTVIDGTPQLSEVRLRERDSEKVDEWTTRYRKRIRVLQLVQSVEGEGEQSRTVYRYVQRVFVHTDWHDEDGTLIADTTNGSSAKDAPGTGPAKPVNPWIEQEPVVPLDAKGKPFAYIPFWIINTTDQSPAVRRPPMLGLANANVSHYNTSGALENALFWCGNPQPWAAGVDPDRVKEFVVGGSTVWTFPAADAKVGMLDIGADGVGALEKRLDRLEQNMAILGAKMLSADKRQVEAAETARINKQGEISVLAGVCGSVSQSMTDAARVATEWQGVLAEKVVVKIQTSFYDSTITLDDALKAVQLWQKNVISIDDLLALLKKGELVAPDRTPESIASDNQSSPIQPIMVGLTDGTGSTPPKPGAPPAPKPPAPKPPAPPAPTPPKG